MEIQQCVRCGRSIRAPQGINQTGDPAIAIYIVAKTVGIRPRVTSPAERKVFCSPCAVSIAFGPPPPDGGAFNAAIYSMLVNLVSAGTQVIGVAWEQKANPTRCRKLMPGSRPDLSLSVPLIEGDQLPGPM